MRTALITGGAQGIGAAVARKFLGDGFSGVLLLTVTPKSLQQRKSRSAKALKFMLVTCVILALRRRLLPRRSSVLAGLMWS